jgi:hypothetical protein
VSELKNQKMAVDTLAHAKQLLKNKEEHINSEIWFQMVKRKVWVVVLGEDMTHNGNCELQRESRPEEGPHFHNQARGAMERLVYA